MADEALAGVAANIAPGVVIGPAANIATTAQIGTPYRALQFGEWDRLNRDTVIGAGCDIGHFCLVGEEAQLGPGTILDVYCFVEGGATLGGNVLLTHRGSVGAKSTIHDGAIIAALICERSVVGPGSRVLGTLAHRQLDPSVPWDAPEAEEPSPRLGANVFVGWGATVVGGINIGDGAYICAGAMVTKDVPDEYVVIGTNEMMPAKDWKGALGKSRFFSHNRAQAG